MQQATKLYITKQTSVVALYPKFPSGAELLSRSEIRYRNGTSLFYQYFRPILTERPADRGRVNADANRVLVSDLTTSQAAVRQNETR